MVACAAARIAAAATGFDPQSLMVFENQLLHLHRNSVKYRVTKALAERPEALAEGKTDLAVALQVCLHLGPTVLTPKT